MSIFKNLENEIKADEQAAVVAFEAWWNNKVKPFIHDDVEPALKKFIQQFDSKLGAQALTAALDAVASLSGGAGFAAVATALATQLFKDAKNDAEAVAEADAGDILQTVQSALQVAKISSAVTTPADQTAAAAISA